MNDHKSDENAGYIKWSLCKGRLVRPQCSSNRNSNGLEDINFDLQKFYSLILRDDYRIIPAATVLTMYVTRCVAEPES
jgi:hypothetical protein